MSIKMEKRPGHAGGHLAAGGGAGARGASGCGGGPRGARLTRTDQRSAANAHLSPPTDLVRSGGVAKRNKSRSPKTSPMASPTRRESAPLVSGAKATSVNQANEYATKVKKLVTYQGGRLETLLLPMLVTAMTQDTKMTKPKSRKSASPIEQDMQALAIMDEPTTLVGGFLKKPVVAYDAAMQAVDLDNVPMVIKDEPPNVAVASTDEESAEEDDAGYGGGSDGEGEQANGKYRNQRNQQAGQFRSKSHNQDGKAGQVIGVLLHALECNDCDDNACKKMRLVLGHFLSCKKYSAQGCSVCQQLVGIVGLHSSTCGRGAFEPGCPVPMCDTMRMEEEVKRRVRERSQVERCVTGDNHAAMVRPDVVVE